MNSAAAQREWVDAHRSMYRNRALDAERDLAYMEQRAAEERSELDSLAAASASARASTESFMLLFEGLARLARERAVAARQAYQAFVQLHG